MFVSAQDSVSQTPQFIIGSDVWTCNSNMPYVQMWTSSQFEQKFGRTFDYNVDFISVMNGDAGTQGYAAINGCYYDSGTIGCYLSGHNTGNIRLTYLVVLHT